MQNISLAELSSDRQIEYVIIINLSDSLRNKIVKVKEDIQINTMRISYSIPGRISVNTRDSPSC